MGTLHAILSWVHRLDDESNPLPELSLNVSGAAGGDFREHLTWCDMAICAGDVLMVEVREDLEVDAPKERCLDEEAGLDEASRLWLQKRRLERLLAEVNAALGECGSA